MVLRHHGQLLHERGTNVHCAEGRIDTLRVINGGIDGRIGKNLMKGHDHALGSPHLVEVIVNQCYSHHTFSCGLKD